MSLPLRFADTHVHLWNLAGGFRYSWLDGADDGFLGRVSEIRIADWLPSRFDEETRFTPPAFTVHVQASDAPTPSWEETAWLIERRSPRGTPDAIVSRINLRTKDVGFELAANIEAGAGRLRGVRDMSSTGTLSDPRVLENLARVAGAGLSWEASYASSEVETVRDIANALPGLTIVVGHAGWPGSRDDQEFRRWHDAMEMLAEAPNIVCKVSGPGMTDHAWTAARWAPYVHGSLETFGPERCLFGSNWPVERIYASYESQLRRYTDILGDSGLSAPELDAFWFTNALRIYAPNKGTNS